jgi:hypothetical protein
MISEYLAFWALSEVVLRGVTAVTASPFRRIPPR